MDDIERQDRALFLRELASGGRWFYLGIPIALLTWGFMTYDSPFNLVAAGAMVAAWVVGAHKSSIAKRWTSPHLRRLWMECENRLQLFQKVLSKMRKEQIADLQEMPKTVERVALSVYAALRRADFIAKDVQSTEQSLHQRPTVWIASSKDSHAQELYKIADRNIAEYRQHLQGVMAGVQRTEAQAAVFITTVDTLRMKMIGYRFAGRSPEVSHREFISALDEAKLQLQSIDHALEELDFGAARLELETSLLEMEQAVAATPEEHVSLTEPPPFRTTPPPPPPFR